MEASQDATTTLLSDGDSKLKALPHPRGMLEVCATLMGLWSLSNSNLIFQLAPTRTRWIMADDSEIPRK